MKYDFDSCCHIHMKEEEGTVTEVKVGQVWADNDPRSEGRTVRVDVVDGRRAFCTVITNSNLVQQDVSDPHRVLPVNDRRGKTTSIHLDGFDGSRRGYVLVKESE